MQPIAEHVHWMFAAGFLILGLLLVTEMVVGTEVWRARAWRAYLWPGLMFFLGLMLWPVMTFYTNSAIHMIAHGSWAQTMMLAGAAQLGLVSGRLRHRAWELTLPLALLVSGTAVLVHEQNSWLFARAAFLHHAEGWVAITAGVIQLARVWRPRALVVQGGFAVTLLTIAVLLYADRDLAPIFGHLSRLAGVPHR
jgi:hypothetical protein